MNGPCVQKDDIENDLIMRLVNADLIALITPVYYWHVSAQLKTCIDRFYARTGRISGKQSVLLAAAGSNLDWTMECLNKYYATLSSYMRWQTVAQCSRPTAKRAQKFSRLIIRRQPMTLAISYKNA